VIVINAGTIAAARPLALELARQADCSVVAYTHAGLCTLPSEVQARSPPLTHSASGSKDIDFAPLLLSVPLGFAFIGVVEFLGLAPETVAEATRADSETTFSAWAYPPLPLKASPTSDAESQELVAVLRHVGASKGGVV
jgi:hypothetical protein